MQKYTRTELYNKVADLRARLEDPSPSKKDEFILKHSLTYYINKLAELEESKQKTITA